MKTNLIQVLLALSSTIFLRNNFKAQNGLLGLKAGTNIFNTTSNFATNYEPRFLFGIYGELSILELLLRSEITFNKQSTSSLNELSIWYSLGLNSIIERELNKVYYWGTHVSLSYLLWGEKDI